MIRWTYFPKNLKLPDFFIPLIDVFDLFESEISSDTNSLASNEVLAKVSQGLVDIGLQIETSKKKKDKIRIPVLFGEQGKEDLAFEADGFWLEQSVVLEVEAGRAVTNYQFLKDYFQASMMYNVDCFCIVVRKKFKGS